MDTETVAVSRRSRAAFVALGLWVAGLIIGTALGASRMVSASPSDPPAWLVVAALVVFSAFIASVVIGIVALIRIRRARGGLTGRIAAWVSVIVSALVLTAGVAGALASTSSGLIKDDFEEGRFWTEDDDATVRQRFVDGGYEVLIKAAGQPSMSRYFSDQPATPAVTFTSDATIVDDAGGDAFVGVTCWGSPAFGYLGAVGSDGSTVILRAYNDRKPDLLSEGSEAPSIQVGTPAQLSLECRGGGSAPTELVLRVNGEEVERAEDPEGLDGFMGVGLWYASERAGTVARWNDSRSQTS